MTAPLRLAGMGLAGVLLLGACEHPVALSSAHVEAMEIVLRDSAGVEIARTVDNTRWQGGGLAASIDRPLRVDVRFLDIYGGEFDIGHRDDVSIRLEASDGVGASWEHFGAWGYLHAHRTGSLQVRFLVWHVDHPDFISPWIDLTVSPPAAKKGLAP